MNGIKIEIENEQAKIFTPYNSVFVDKIKNIGKARWNSQDKCWTIPADMIEPAREIMRGVYGYADNDVVEMVKVRVRTLKRLEGLRAPVELMGKVLSIAYGRDSGASPGEDVAYVSGQCRSGGSVKNWHSEVDEGSVIILNNVSKVLYERYLENPSEDLDVELIEPNNKREELIREKEQLLARLEVIEKKLTE